MTTGTIMKALHVHALPSCMTTSLSVVWVGAVQEKYGERQGVFVS